MDTKSALTVFALIVLTAGGFFLYTNYGGFAAGPQKIYSSDTYGLSFEYPATYSLQEIDLGGSGGVPHHAIVLIAESAAQIPAASDGPPAITVELYRNDFSQRQLENWVRGSSVSNFTQSIDGRLAAQTVAGVPALFYRWDGLYRSDTYALGHGTNVILLSVTYNAPDDQIRQDFDQLISSLTLY